MEVLRKIGESPQVVGRSCNTVVLAGHKQVVHVGPLGKDEPCKFDSFEVMGRDRPRMWTRTGACGDLRNGVDRLDNEAADPVSDVELDGVFELAGCYVPQPVNEVVTDVDEAMADFLARLVG